MRRPIAATCLARVQPRHGMFGLVERGKGVQAHLAALADAAPVSHQSGLTEEGGRQRERVETRHVSRGIDAVQQERVVGRKIHATSLALTRHRVQRIP